MLSSAAMLRKKPHNKVLICRLGVIALAIWLGGLNCLLCCGPFEAASQAKAETCSTSVSSGLEQDDCCKTESSGEETPAGDSCDGEYCFLNAPSTELPNQINLHQTFAATLPPVLIPTELESIPPASFSFDVQRLQNQRGTYLRCCVFLI